MLHLGDYRQVLAHIKADLILTSPPYNIGSKSERCDGFRRSGKFDPKSFGAIRDYPDALNEPEYQDQQVEFLIWCADHLTKDGILVYNHKPRRRKMAMIHPCQWLLRREVSARLTLMEEVIWNRGSTHNHGRQLMWPQTERLYVFCRAGGRYKLDNNEKLIYRSDLWNIARAPSNGHNAPFPIALAEAVIEAWSKEGDLVCDPYAGSCTTGVAALALGREFEGAEILSKYFKLALARLAEVQLRMAS